MSDQKSTSEDDDPVRKKLRDLPKSKAPWYFEARLQQRIRGGSKAQENWFTARPLPALALSVGVFLFVCIAGYNALISPSGNEQQALLPDSSESTTSTPRTISEPEKTSPSPEQNVDFATGKAGPHAQSPDPTVESGIQGQGNQQAATSNSPKLQPEVGASNKANPAQFDSLAKRGGDSTKSKRDSVTVTK